MKTNDPQMFTNATASNLSTTGFSMEKFQELVEKFDALREKHLRQSAEMVEETTCPVCGRKPTVTQGPFGETVVVCPHIWCELKTRIPRATTPLDASAMLRGLRFEVFDDGPARW
jgi:hypothetical protein